MLIGIGRNSCDSLTAMSTTNETAHPIADGLRGYARVLLKRWWIIALCVVVLVGITAAYCLTATTKYTATVELELTPSVSSSVSSSGSSITSQLSSTVDVTTEMAVIASTIISAPVAAKLPGVPPVSVSQVGTTNVVELSVTSTKPVLAATAANLYAQSYLSYKLKHSTNLYSTAISSLEKNLASLQSRIAALTQQLGSSSGTTAAALQVQINQLESSANQITTQISSYQTNLNLANGGGHIITPATIPTSPSSPKTLEYLGLALIVSLVIGAGAALVLDSLDRSVRTPERLFRALGDVPLLGMIPSVGAMHESGYADVIARDDPNSLATEAYRSVRTSIQFLALEQNIRSLQIASPQSGDGKTTLVANLAAVLAAAGTKVIVVDGDLRRPRLHATFDLSQEPGLTDLLAGQGDLAANLRPVESIPGLNVVTAGPIPHLPSEMLASSRFGSLIAECAAAADLVLVDSPPLLAVTDGEVIARTTDATLIVAAARQTSERHIRQSIAAVDGIGGHVLGFVINDVDRHDLVDYDKAGYYAAQISYRSYGAGPAASGGADHT